MRSVVTGNDLNAEQQARAFASHSVVVATHGAGLMNLVFMAPLSALIELFPYHLDHNLYTGMAANLGIASYPVHGRNGSIVWPLDQVRPSGLQSGPYACVRVCEGRHTCVCIRMCAMVIAAMTVAVTAMHCFRRCSTTTASSGRAWR